MKVLPPQQYPRERFSYNKRKGTLRWRRRPYRHFATPAIARGINKRFAGKPALACMDQNGYLNGTLGGVAMRASRVIWKLVTGKDPDREVEHKNRKRGNNRWHNLRLALHHENGRNRNIPANNKSGFVGVIFNKSEQKWKAHVTVKQKRIHVGTFSNKKLAVLARRNAAALHYGEFAS